MEGAGNQISSKLEELLKIELVAEFKDLKGLFTGHCFSFSAFRIAFRITMT